MTGLPGSVLAQLRQSALRLFLLSLLPWTLLIANGNSAIFGLFVRKHIGAPAQAC